MQLGQHIVDSVVESGAIERMIQEGDSRIFVWASNANEQAEAAFLKRIDSEIRSYANSDDNITDFLSLLKVGTERGHSAPEISRRVIAHTLLQFFGIDPST